MRTAAVPVTHSQASLYFAEAMCPEEGAYNMAFAIDVEGQVPDAGLVAAAHRAYRAIPALRLRLGIDDGSGEIVSWFHDQLPDVEVVDMDGAGPDAVADAVDAATRRAIDTDEGGLARFLVLRTGRTATLAVVFHHLVADGLCHVPFAERLARCVVGDLPAEDGRDYVGLVRRIRERETRAAAELRGVSFARLPEDLLARTRLPCRADGAVSRGGRTVVIVDAEATRGLREQARRLETSLFKVLIGAVHHALPADDGGASVVCTAASQRPAGGEADSLIGCFINEVPLPAARYGSDTVADIVLREGAGWHADLRRRDFPYAELARRADPAGTSAARLDSVMVGYRKLTRTMRWTGAGVTCRAVLEQPFPTPKTEISLRFLDRGDTLECEVQWGRSLVETAGAAFAAELGRSLAGAAAVAEGAL